MKLTAMNAKPSLGAPVASSQALGWENIVVEQFCSPPGEAHCHYPNEHSIYLALGSRPICLRQNQDGKTFTGLYGKGDVVLTPEKTPIFARWEAEDHCLQIRISSHFIQTVADESLGMNADRLELIPEFRAHDPQIEAIGHLLLSELKQANVGGTLYVESLTNLLAVHLLRHYASKTPRPTQYAGGLSQRQLVTVLDYIQAHLSQDIRLADLAALLKMSPFHFSHLFKQSLGVAPYQYLLQQRVELAKRHLMLPHSSITEIAFLCGFNSHSHLTKQFRQITGMTPSAYRTSVNQ